MSSHADTVRAGWRAGGAAAFATAAISFAMLAPQPAPAGVTTLQSRETGGIEVSPPVAKPAAPPARSKAKGAGYQMRCWQQGRLLFEENGVALPSSGSGYALKPAGTDRNGRPVYVADTATATCLIRSAPEPRSAAEPYSGH